MGAYYREGLFLGGGGGLGAYYRNFTVVCFRRSESEERREEWSKQKSEKEGGDWGEVARGSLAASISIFSRLFHSQLFATFPLSERLEKAILRNLTQNAPVKRRGRYEMNFCRESKPQLTIIGDCFQDAVSGLEKLANFFKFQPISIVVTDDSGLSALVTWSLPTILDRYYQQVAPLM